MKPLCILHAGTEKTGSTSLQAFLRLNAAALAARNIWVPRALVVNPAEEEYNHIKLSTASRMSFAEPDNLQKALGLRDMEAVAAHRAGMTAALAAEHAGLGYSPARIIISSEHVHSRLGAVEDLARARALLAPYCGDFHLTLYLRRQDELARSVASMVLAHGAETCRLIPDFNTPHGFDEILGVERGYFDYAGLLGRLEAVFGAAALHPRLYAPAEVPRFDIITDFFAHAGIDIAGLPRPPRRNTGFSPQAADLLIYVNQRTAGHPRRAAVRDRVIRHLAAHMPGHLPPAPAAEVERFMAAFAAGNEVVRQRWFPARASLFAPVAPGDGPAHVPLTEAEAAALLAGILRAPPQDAA